jgi:hypothetical protein
MRRIVLAACGLSLLFAQTARTPAQRLAQWKQVAMPFRSTGLTKSEIALVEKLVDACRLLDNIYWRQSDLAGLSLYKTTQDKTVKELLAIMGSRWDLLDANAPFVGADKMPPGHELYPKGMTRAQIERYVARYPSSKDAIYNPYTVVQRLDNGLLTAVPYHVRYKQFIDQMSRDLHEAAGLTPDPAFAKFLNLRADGMLTDNYYASDLAWLDLQNPKIDIIFAPYETYLDDLLGVKTSFGASVLIRDEEESQKLAVYQKYVPQIQEALPVDAAAKPSKQGHLTPMEVMDAPYRAGDLRHGYQAVADNLPNDPRIHQEKGTKKIFFKNFMDARVDDIILPVAQILMKPDQAAKATAEGYMASTLLHEISHELGPAFARRAGKRVDIREAIGPAYSGLEEAKADVTGMFGLKWLVDHAFLPKERLPEYYASYVAGIFRTLRFGTGEAHGRAEMMEFNYLQENGALAFADGRYTIDYQRIPAVLEQLCKRLLEMEDSGDRAGAEAWFTKYDKIPGELAKALTATASIPVDVDPVFSFPDRIQ